MARGLDGTFTLEGRGGCLDDAPVPCWPAQVGLEPSAGLSTSRPAMNFVRMEGSGFGRPNADNELPIDIPYQKLSAWLVTPCSALPAVCSFRS